jgi:N-acetylglucosamine kinase
VTNRATLPTPHTSWGDFVATLRRLIEADGGAARIGISIAGAADSATGIALAANVPVVTGHRVESEVAEVLGIPVRVGNDADCFALAEAMVGAGRGLPIVFGAILGTGVGGGLVINGRMVRGAHGVTGEWGHAPLLAEAVAARGIPVVRCGCGQTGCLDSYGSARGLERIHMALAGETRSSRAITEAWHAGDVEATKSVEAFVELVAGPLSMIVNTIGPSIIPVGGGLSSDSVLLGAIDEAVRARVLGRYQAPLVVPGQTRGASGLIGAAMLAEEREP